MSLLDKFENLFPEHLRDNEEYKVLIKLVGSCLDEKESEIAKFTDLIDVDNCPDKFLPYLSKILDYNYRFDLSTDDNREIIKNLFSIYGMRGTDRSIIMAATHYSNPGYVGGNIFVPGTYKRRDEAWVTYPRDNLFQRSRSTYSGPHKTSDEGLNQEGVMEVVVPMFDSTIREWVEKVKPAGIRLKFRLELVPSGDTPVVSTDDPVVLHEMTLSIDQYLPFRYTEPSRGYSGSCRSTNLTLSGRSVLMGDTSLEISSLTDARRRLLPDSPITEWYNISDVSDDPTELQLPANIVKLVRGNIGYSSGFGRSSAIPYSGIPSVDLDYLEYHRDVLFKSPIYTLSELLDHTLGDTRFDRQDTQVDNISVPGAPQLGSEVIITKSDRKVDE